MKISENMVITASNGETATLEELAIALVESFGDTIEQTDPVAKKLLVGFNCAEWEMKKYMWLESICAFHNKTTQVKIPVTSS